MKYSSVKVLCPVIALFLFGLSAGFAQDAPDSTIRVQGAVIATDQVRHWAVSFMEANAGTRVVVIGSSAGKGLESLFEKRADIAMVGRVISPEDHGKAQSKEIELRDCPVGESGIAVITSPHNSVSELSLPQLRRIFSGEFSNWNQVGGPNSPIRCFTRRIPESAGALFFQEKALDKLPYGRNTAMLESWGSIIKVCATATDLPIGIAPIAPALAAGSSIKVIGVKPDEQSPAVTLSEESLRDKTYPLIVSFRFYWDAKTLSSRGKQFVDYCVSQGSAAKKSMNTAPEPVWGNR